MERKRREFSLLYRIFWAKSSVERSFNNYNRELIMIRLPIYVHRMIDDMPLSANAFRVYGHLARRFNKEKGVAWPSLQEIGDHCFGLDYKHPDSRRKHAATATAELERAGLIRKETYVGAYGHKSYRYILLDTDALESHGYGAVESHSGNAAGFQGNGTVESHSYGATRSHNYGTERSHEGVLSEGTPKEGLPLAAATPLPTSDTHSQSVQAKAVEATPEANTGGKKVLPPKQASGEPKTPTPHQALVDGYYTTLTKYEPKPRINGEEMGKAAKWLLENGYTPEQVTYAVDTMKGDEYWQGKHLSLTSLSKQIAALIAKRDGMVKAHVSKRSARWFMRDIDGETHEEWQARVSAERAKNARQSG